MNPPDPRSRTLLVLGATGGLGGEAARQFRAAGWHVRALNRRADQAARQAPAFEWVQGDAMNAADVRAAACGAVAIVHAVNPPGYQKWAEWVLPMLDHTLEAARATGARVVLPGNVYNYGLEVRRGAAARGAGVPEDAPQQPSTRKGLLRVAMEERLARAAGQGVSSLVLRAGDFFGGGSLNNWFSQGVLVPGSGLSKVRQPGRAGVGHLWAYVPDVAATLVRLLENPEGLPPVARFQFGGHWDASGHDMVDAIVRVSARATGRTPRVAGFPWWMVPLGAPFVPFLRELLEMRYLWSEPLRLDNRRLVSRLGREPHTPLDEAVRASLQDLGLIPAGPQAATARPPALNP